MLTLLISAAASIALIYGGMAAGARQGTLIFIGIIGFIAAYYLISLLVRKKIAGTQAELQEIMLKGQQRMTRKIQQFQNKPGGNIKLMQRQIEADQKTIHTEALQFTEQFERFKMWNLLMGRQIASMRLQFFYQLQEFNQVDELLSNSGFLKGPMMMEPMMVAMKMARQYKNKETARVEKTFKRHIKWFRSDRGTLLYALMSWILLKEGKADEARKLLSEAKEKTGDETLAQNWEYLANNKEKSFSNVALGDEWFSLYLEKPPTPKQQRMRGNPHQSRRF